MLEQEELLKKMIVLPSYSKEILTKTTTERMIALNDFYKIFKPTKENAVNIYNSLYLALKQSIDRKQFENSYLGVSSAMSYSVLGKAGVGKTSLIKKSIELCGADLITIDNSENVYQIIPFLFVEAPISSIKSLMLLIVEKVDSYLNTSYLKIVTSRKYTLDQLINLVINKICKQFVGCLCIDEIQNILNYKQQATANIINTLTAISNAGCTVIMIGVSTEVQSFFSSTSFLARRSLPVEVKNFDFDEEFKNLVLLMLNYNYAPIALDFNYSLFSWFYARTNGVPALLQEIVYRGNLLAIQQNKDITMSVLEQAFAGMKTIHDYVEIERIPSKTMKNKTIEIVTSDKIEDFDLVELVMKCKNNTELDVWTLIQDKMEVLFL